MLKDRDRDGYWYRLGKCLEWIDLVSIGEYIDIDIDNNNNNNINNSNNNK